MAKYLRPQKQENAHPCFKKVNLEEVFDKNNVSGLDVMEKCPETDPDCNPSFNHGPYSSVAEDCGMKGYKYICQDRTH